jgi:hypothetical protein
MLYAYKFQSLDSVKPENPEILNLETLFPLTPGNLKTLKTRFLETPKT